MFSGGRFGEYVQMPARKAKTCPPQIRFGENLAGLRERLGLTQEGLAEKAGISVRFVQNVEAGESFPRMAKLVRLKEVLRCSWADLFAGCDRPTK